MLKPFVIHTDESYMSQNSPQAFMSVLGSGDCGECDQAVFSGIAGESPLCPLGRTLWTLRENCSEGLNNKQQHDKYPLACLHIRNSAVICILGVDHQVT